jgi:transketolase
VTYADALRDIVLADGRFIVMTAENRAAIRELPGQLNGRFIDTGITEQTLIGAAAGLALRGRIPVVHALAAFLTMRAFEFIRSDVGIGQLPVKLVGGVPGFLSDANGPTHQAIEDVALMRAIPGMQIFCPADAEDLLLGLPHVLHSPQPVYVRYIDLPAVVAHDPEFALGRAEVVRNGRDLTILVYGMLLREAITAAEILAAKGLSVRVLNLRTLAPIDAAAILRAVRETALIVTLEDHFLTGGLFSIVAELLLRRRQTADVLPIALEQRWFKPTLLDDVLRVEGFTGPQIAARILAHRAQAAQAQAV